MDTETPNVGSIDINRKELEFILKLTNTPYRLICIYQGRYNSEMEMKLFAIECENFAFVEKLDPYEGGIVGYFFVNMSKQNLYDLQHWHVVPNKEINVVDMGAV